MKVINDHRSEFHCDDHLSLSLHIFSLGKVKIMNLKNTKRVLKTCFGMTYAIFFNLLNIRTTHFEKSLYQIVPAVL